MRFFYLLFNGLNLRFTRSCVIPYGLVKSTPKRASMAC